MAMGSHQGVLTLALTMALLALLSLANGEVLHIRPTSTRAVVAGPVSPVSTGPLFPRPLFFWHRHYSADARKAPKYTGDMLKLARWLRTGPKMVAEAIS